MLPALSRERPETVWVMLWPQQSIGNVWRWRDDGLFAGAYPVTRFPWPYPSAMREGVTAFDPERFAELERRWAPTVYWLSMVEMGVNVHGGLRQSFGVMARPTLIAQHHYIIHESLPYPIAGLFGRQWLQIGGSIAADRVVTNSRYTTRMMTEAFSAYLNPAALRAITDKTETLPFGFVDDDLATHPITPHDKPVVIYNHRFELYKQPKVTADVLRSLRSRFDFEVWITQYIAQKVGEFPFDRTVGDPDHRVYLDNIAVPAINTLNSVHETFCISVLDSLALGHVVVLPNRVTFPELVPEGYPYLFESTDEQTRMLASILRDWPRAHDEWSSRLREHARSRFNLDDYARRYASILHDNDDLYRTEPKATTIANRNRMFAALKPGTYPLDDIAKVYRRTTGLMEQAAPNRRVVRDVIAAGGRPAIIGGKGGDTLGLTWEARP